MGKDYTKLDTFGEDPIRQRSRLFWPTLEGGLWMYLAQGGEEVLAPPTWAQVESLSEIKSRLCTGCRGTRIGVIMESGSNGTIRPADLEQTVPLIHKTNLDSRISGIDQSTLWTFTELMESKTTFSFSTNRGNIHWYWWSPLRKNCWASKDSLSHSNIIMAQRRPRLKFEWKPGQLDAVRLWRSFCIAKSIACLWGYNPV